MKRSFTPWWNIRMRLAYWLLRGIEKERDILRRDIDALRVELTELRRLAGSYRRAS